MFEKLLAWLAILIGILWTTKPEVLRGWLTRKTHMSAAWLLLGVLFFPLIRLGRVAGLAGIIVLLVLLWLVVSGLYDKLRKFFQQIPLACFQIAGLFQVVSGIWILRK